MTRSRRHVLLLAGVLGLSVLSCGRDVTGPNDGLVYGRNRIADLNFAPEFPALPGANAASDLVPFTRVRVTLLRTDGTVSKDTLVDFPSTADSVALALEVPLPLTASDTGITLGLTMAYVNTQGDTVFRAGPQAITAKPSTANGGQSQPITIPVRWVPPAGSPLPTSVTLTPATGSAVAGTTTTLTAVARDAQGNALPGIPVGFSSLDTSRATVASVGSNVVTWKAKRGTALVVASLLNGPADTSAFSISLPAALLVPVSGTGQSATINTALAQPLTWRVVASDSVPVAGVPVTFAATTGGGTLGAAADTSDANGLVSTTWTLGALVGTQSVTATLGAGSAATSVVTAGGAAPIPTQLAITSAPTTAVAGATLAPVTVEVRDANGAKTPLFTGAVSLALNAGTTGATLGGTTTVNAVAGVATFSTLSIQKVAAGLTLTASSGTLTAATTAPLAVTPAAAASLSTVSGGAQTGTVGTTLTAPFVVRVADAFGNVVAGQTVTWSVASGSGTLSAASSTTDSTGVASTTLTLGTAAGTVTVSASAGSLSGSPTTFTATAIAGGATQLVLTSGPIGPQVAGVPLPNVVVEARDAAGNRATSFTGEVKALVGGTLQDSAATTAVAGVATFSGNFFETSGTYVVTFTAPGLTSAVSNSFTVAPGSATVMTAQSALTLSGTAGLVLPAAAAVGIQDAFSNVVPGTVVSFALLRGADTVSTAQVTADSTGRAAWQPVLPQTVGTASIVARATGLTNSPITFTVNVFTGPAVRLAMVTQPTATAAGATLAAVAVDAKDQFGNRRVAFTAQVTVAVDSGPSGATLVGTTTVTPVSGVATFSTLALDKAGTYRLRFTTPGLTDAVSSAFTIVAGAPALVNIVSGSAQTEIVGTALADSLVVRVTDGNGNPVSGATVTWAATSGGGAISPSTGTTDVNGRAAARWTLGSLLGAQGATATVGTLTAATFTATALATPPAAITVVSGDAQSVRQGAVFALPVRVRVTDAGALPVAGVPVAFVVTSGEGVASPALDTTDANGIAETNWTAGDSAGAATLRATVQGTALTVTATGTQLSSAPTTLTFETQPAAIAAGQRLPSIRLVVRDATADTVRSFTGSVTLSLTGGTTGAALVGLTTVAASNGVVQWDSLTVDRVGTGYRLSAAITGGPSAQSSTFDVTASLPATLAVDAGNNQSVLPGVAYPDSLVVRVTDVFGAAKAGVTVSWSVLAGGGSVSPATSVTDVNGRARARWTAGTGGTQEVRASVSGLVPVTFTGTVIALDGPPLLFVTADAVSPSIGRQQPVTIFLSNPTPAPLTVTLAMRDTVATWAATSLTIPPGGTQVSTTVTGVAQGATWGVASSNAGNDSLQVFVGPSSANIAGGPFFYFATGDTVRTRVVLSEPAPAGGLTLTVRSADTTTVRVAPGSGLGVQEDDCGFSCDNPSLLAEGAPPEPTLLAPAGATASITIPAGQFVGHLVMLTLAPTSTGTTAVTIEGTNLVSNVANISVSNAAAFLYCQVCSAAPGHADGLSVGLSEALRRDVTLRVRSLDPSIVAVRDSIAVISAKANFTDEVLRVIALDTGTARLVVSAPGVQPDTVLFSVVPRGLSLTAYGNGSRFLEVGAQQQQTMLLGRMLGQFGFSTGPGVAEATTITVVSRDPSVVRVDLATLQIPVGDYTGEVRYTGAGAGETWLVASAPGYPTDSMLVIVSESQVSVYGGQGELGVGSRQDDFLVQLSSSALASAVPVTITSSDPDVLRVLTPTIVAPAGSGFAEASLEGRSAGTVSLTISVPGRQPQTFAKTVIASRLFLQGFNFESSQTLDLGSAPVEVAAITGVALQSSNLAQFASDTVLVVLRSTNPSVLQVTDSLMRIAPGSYYSTVGTVRALAAGAAQLTVSAAGRQSDTSALITVLPARLVAPGYLFSGTGGLTEIGVVRTSEPTAALPVSLTLRSTSGSTLAQSSATFAADSSTVTVALISGPSIGMDTLIVSAPGHLPDTTFIETRGARVILIVPSPLAYLSQTMLAGSASDSLTALLTDEQNYAFGFRTAAARRIRVTSSDTTVVRVSADTLVWAAGDSAASPRLVLKAGRPGTALLVTTSLTDATLPDTVAIEVVGPRLLQPNFGGLSLGMGVQTSEGEQYIERTLATAAPVWVRFTSSAPSIVIVPDSVLIPAGETTAYYRIASGDSVGSGVITFSATGHEGGTIPVTVSRSTIAAYVPSPPSVGTTAGVQLYALDNSYIARARRAATPLRLSAADTSVLQVLRDTTSIPAGVAYVTLPAAMRGRRAGTTPVTVTDRRTTFDALSPLATSVEVVTNRLRLLDDRFEVATGGTASTISNVQTEWPVDSLWVRVRTLNGKAAVAQDSVLVQTSLDNAPLLGLRGVSAGTDTVVVSAPGFGPDTAIVRVTPGYFGTEGTIPATIRQGDSVAVALVLYSPDGQPVSVGPAPITVNFSVPPNVDIRLNGATVTTAQFPAGASSFTVYLRGIAPGTGIITVSSPIVTSTSATITTRAP